MTFFGRKTDSFNQNYLIANYNALATSLARRGIVLNKLPPGVCHGLTINYLLFAHQNRLKEFYRYLLFIAKLNQQQIDNLVQREDINNHQFFNGLLKFLKGVVDAQMDPSFFKFVGAHHDESAFIFCEGTSKEDLIPKLTLEFERLEIKNGSSMHASMGGHAFAIIKTESGFRVFEPNHIQANALLFKTEAEVASTIVENIDASKFFSNFDLRLSISFLSWANENAELDELIAQVKHDICDFELIKGPVLTPTIKVYLEGRLARTELAMFLHDKLSELTLSEKLVKFRNDLSDYLKAKNIVKEQENISNLLSNKNFVLGTSYKWQVASLSFAVMENQISLVKKLLAEGADTNVTLRNITPLGDAVKNGNIEIVEILLAHKVNVDALNTNGSTSLCLAVYKGHIDIVEKLMAEGANVNIANDEGLTALFIAAHKGYIGIVKKLIAKGASVNAVINSGMTPLWIAAESGHKEIVEILLASGAEIDAKTIYDVTPLCVAAQKGHLEVVKILLTHAATVNHSIPASVKVLLAQADKMGCREELEVLLTKETNELPEIIYGFTPLHAAVFFRHFEIVKLLLANGADIDARIAGISIFDLAKLTGQFELLQNPLLQNLLSENSVGFRM